MVAIDIDNLTKRFGDVVAVDELDLEVAEGEVFGFLGPNGAGKSTTINVLLDFMRPTSGTVEVFGLDAQQHSTRIRERVGVLPEGFDLYDRLTGRKHVQFAVDMKDADDDPDALLERAGIADAADRKAGGYSKGMKQRLALAMALAGDPDLLILDEPSTGLDPNGMAEVREIVREEVADGATVFFSSHLLNQVEAVCDRVGILHEGSLVAVDTIEGLREAAGDGSQFEVTVDSDLVGVDFGEIEGVSEAVVDGRTVRVTCTDSSAKARVIDRVEEMGATVTDISSVKTSLEDVFAAYTTGEAADDRRKSPEEVTP